MADRLDAHIHLFRNGFGGTNPRPSELQRYIELARQHNIKSALVVGYEGAAWAAGNNAYLAHLMREHDWIRATAYVGRPEALTVRRLERWAGQGFIGISLYLFDAAAIASLAAVGEGVWAWLRRHKWLVSVNGRGVAWQAWGAVLERHSELRLVISHMGLPPAQSRPPEAQKAEKQLAPVTALARFEGVHVKISGFYALSQPRHNYPHRAVWPYVQALLKHFGARRLVWGSDFTPALNSVSFPQTVDVLGHLSGLSSTARRQIEGANLRRLLQACL